MIDAAALETRLRSGAFGDIATAYLHRATRETSSAVLHGREALLAVALAEAAALPEAALALGFCHTNLATFALRQDELGWRGHRWLEREGNQIIREILVEDGQARMTALCVTPNGQGLAPIHAPIGELRPGYGQFAAPEAAIVPAHWPDAARPVANIFHQIWNGRAIDRLALLWHADANWRGPNGACGDRAALARWLTALFAAVPDATLMFERAIVGDGTIALLWRLHGHQHGHHAGWQGFGAPSGRRVRIIGSSVLKMEAGRVIDDETLIDTLAMARQLAAPPIAWRAATNERATS